MIGLSRQGEQGTPQRAATQACDGRSIQIDLRPPQLKALERTGRPDAFGQSIDAAVGHVQGHVDIKPVHGLDHQSMGSLTVGAGPGGKRQPDAAFDHRLRVLLEVQRQTSTHNAIFGGQHPARVGECAHRQRLGRDVGPLKYAHSGFSGPLQGVCRQQIDFLIEGHHDFRCQHDVALDLNRTRNINAGLQVQTGTSEYFQPKIA